MTFIVNILRYFHYSSLQKCIPCKLKPSLHVCLAYLQFSLYSKCSVPLKACISLILIKIPLKFMFLFLPILYLNYKSINFFHYYTFSNSTRICVNSASFVQCYSLLTHLHFHIYLLLIFAFQFLHVTNTIACFFVNMWLL